MAVMLASDDNNPQFVGAHNPDAALSVRFYNRAVQDNFQTSVQNRPIFQDVVYVEIFTPGNVLNIIDTPMRDEHKFRFPRQWAHYQNTQGDSREVGTPVAQWSLLTAAQAEEFKAMKFFTVESIANASDLNIGNLGMVGGMSPLALRERARAFLHGASSTAVQEHQAVELAKRDEQIAALQRQMEALLAVAAVPVSTDEPKKSPGRPKVVKSETVQGVKLTEVSQQETA